MATLSGHRSVVRVAAAAAALVAAALTVGASPVSAAPAIPTVEFNGGNVLNLLVCKSEPSAGNVSVPAESRVNFVNRLGQEASLKVDGRSVAFVQPDQAVPVVFKKGHVEVAMTFDCGVGVVEEFKAVSVGVTAPPAAPAAAPGAPEPKKSDPPAGPAGAAAGAAGSAVADRTGMATPTGRSTRVPRSQAGTGAIDGTDSALGIEPADPSLLGLNPSGASALGADPSAAPDAPTGLLALVATVCAVGVGIAAIRAIIAQRSSRLSFA